MNTYLESINQVMTAQNFYFVLGGAIALGMTIGTIYDKGLKGFRQSVVLLMPFILLIFLANLSRINDLTDGKIPEAMAYNGTFTVIILGIAYIFGLFIGHTIKIRASVQARKELDEKEKRR